LNKIIYTSICKLFDKNIGGAMRSGYFIAVLVLVTIFFSCAASVSIGDIKNSPSRFHDKKVSIRGTVDETVTLPILGVGVYQLNDGTGKIWVKPKARIPERGDHVMVKGTIKVGLTISGRSFGLILIESGSDESF
jgi:hypothetical protein